MKKNKIVHMTLTEYLKTNGIYQNFFADKIGATPAALNRVLKMGYAPTLKMALAIEKHTRGIVSIDTWDLSKTAHCVKPETNDNKKNYQRDD